MDGSRLRPGSALYLAVLAHELQHAVHWNLDHGEDSWVDEGMSEVASELSGYRALHVESFLRNPGSQLNYWPGETGTTGPHYGASTLFFSYLAQHYGGYENLSRLVGQPADGVLGVDAYLAPYDTNFRSVFKDWVVANYLDAPDGPFGYPDRRIRIRDVDLVLDYGERQDTLPQFAARYVDLRLSEGDALVEFQGSQNVGQFAAACHSGRWCWWSNRGDAIDTTLTRGIDLSGLERATLQFWTRFEIEEDWDYAYVEVSSDAGATWTTLQSRRTTDEDPIGNNFGHGFTGSSGGWVQERIDLTPYAGQEVLLRFEYVTDDSVYLDGFTLDDVSIPELDFFDDAEREGAWEAAGFVTTDNTLPQDYFVQIIEIGTDGAASVRDLPLDGAGWGQAVIGGFGSPLEHAVIVISPVTLGTHQPAEYKLVIAPSGG